MSTLKTIGFLGMGIMGSRMARNLAQKGFSVVVWNRTASKAQALEAVGARVAKIPAELASQVDAFCTCVADPSALQEVVFAPGGLIEGCSAGQLYVDFSTVSPHLTSSLAAAFREKKVDFVEAPVTGSKNGAERGTLLIMAGGSSEAFTRAAPLFQAVGEKAIHCGPIGSASQVKLAGNALIALMLQGLSEGMLLTKKAGVDPRKLLEVVMASGFRSPYFEFKGEALLKGDFSTHFSIDLMFKDLSLFLESAAKVRVPTPAAAAVREVYQLARASGRGEQDIAATIAPLEELTGTTIRGT